MVCIPCIVIPALLFVWHKWLQPILRKIWNPYGIFGDENSKDPVEAKLDKLNQKLINDATASFLQPKSSSSTNANMTAQLKNESSDLGAGGAVRKRKDD